ncbi:sugar efflux transporter [Nitzschia inconspicua]|uniref:Sugar transporter SWEET1 n=1 Tax=Nitzschia inconspicua TaxID=303405 RepID=A0A9K3KEC7_9STRA|nr:sugar efflux transporter [Nitzschia inconspicua]
MTLSASSIILEYVCPCAGMIIANVMFAAPFQDLQTAVRLGDIGSLNCTPWAFMLGNCFGWVLYGTLRNNFWVYFANAPGLLMSLWLNLGAVKLLYQKHHSTAIRSSLVLFLQQEQQHQRVQQEDDDDDQPQQPIPASVPDTSPSFPTVTGNFIQSAATTTKDWANIVWQVTSQTTPAPTPHERLVLVIATTWMAVATLAGFAGSTNLIQWNDDNDNDNNNPNMETTPTIIISIVGYVVNFNLVFFYGAPLSTIWTVLKQRNTASIHIPTMVTNTLNGSFWLAYGLAVSDAFIYVPNGLGGALGAIQVVLLILFPRQPSSIRSTGTTQKEAANVVTTTIITEPTSLYDKQLHDTDNSSDGDQNNRTQRANNDAFQGTGSPTDDLESPILTSLEHDGTTNIDR